MAKHIFWAKYLHRIEKASGGFLLTDDQGAQPRNVPNMKLRWFIDELYERYWGGIPLVFPSVIVINYILLV